MTTEADLWLQTDKSRREIIERIRALPPEERSTEALLIIAREMMELNENIDRLVMATDRVADSVS